jgi:hypothetical protein
MHVFDGCNGHIRFPVINQLLNLGLFQSCDRAERDYIRVSIAGILPSRYLNQRTSGLKPVPIEHAWISGATISSNKNPILFRCFKGRNWASRLNYLHEFLKRCFFWSSGDKLIFPDCRLAQPCVINAFPIAYIEELPQFMRDRLFTPWSSALKLSSLLAENRRHSHKCRIISSASTNSLWRHQSRSPRSRLLGNLGASGDPLRWLQLS